MLGWVRLGQLFKHYLKFIDRQRKSIIRKNLKILYFAGDLTKIFAGTYLSCTSGYTGSIWMISKEHPVYSYNF